MGKDCVFALRGPGAQRRCARWYADTAYGQGLRLSLRGLGAHVFSAGHHRRPGLLHEAWRYFLGRVHRYTARVSPAHQGGKGWRGRRGACSQVFCHPN